MATTEEALKSNYKYNMIFNNTSTNNDDDDVKFNTNLISDFDLQNFDPIRYEYYVNLLKVFNNDPETLSNLLNKYNSIKTLKAKERKIIRVISDYVNKLKDVEDNMAGTKQRGGGSNKELLSIQKRALILFGNVENLSGKISGDISADTDFKEAINIFINAIETFSEDLKIVEKEDSYNPNNEAIEKFKSSVRTFNIAINTYKGEQNGGVLLFDVLTNKIAKTTGENVNGEAGAHTSVLAALASTAVAPKKKGNTKSILINEAKSLIGDATKLIEDTQTANDKMNEKIIGSKKEFKTLLLEVIEDGKEKNEKAIAEYIKTEEKAIKAAKRKEDMTLVLEAKKNEEMRKNEEMKKKERTNMLGRTDEDDDEIVSPKKLEENSQPYPLNLRQQKELRRQPQGDDILQEKILDVIKGNFEVKKRKLQTPLQSGNAVVGGAAGDDFSDDTLKARYLETRPQRYSRLDLADAKIEEFRNVNKENRESSNSVAAVKTDNKIEQLSNDIDVYNALSSADKDDPIKNDEIIQKIKRFEDDPKNPLEELELTFDDRIVFIIATFFIRYITIIMVQWCIDINIIKTFYEGFIYYAVIYIILFWFIVLFINIDNSFDVKYMNFNGIINSIRTLFYYFYMGTNGISRLLIHTSLILLLIVIPIILNIKKKTEFKPEGESEGVKILDFDERKQLSKALSLFTMFIWLFTSIIATKF